MANINYPFGNPSIFIVPGSASTYEYTIFNDYTIIDAKMVSCEFVYDGQAFVPSGGVFTQS